MGYKIQFEDGQTVEFDSQPSQADIDEAYAQVSKQKQDAQLSGQIDKLKGAGETALGVGSGLLAAIPTGFRALTELAGGASLDEAMERSESTADLLTYKPRTAKGKEYIEATAKMFEDAEQDYGRAYSKELSTLAEKASKEGRNAVPYLKGENTERMAGEVFMNLIPIGFAAKAAARGARVATKGKGLDTKAYTDFLDQAGAEPKLVDRHSGVQGELFSKSNEGVASPYDPNLAGKVEPIQPARQAAQMDLPLGETPATIPVDRKGVARTGMEDPGLVEAVRQDHNLQPNPMNEMMQQLRAGEVEPLPQSARGSPIADVAAELLRQGRKQEYAELVNGLRAMEVQKLEAQKRAQAEQTARQTEMEASVKKNYEDQNIGGEQVQREVMEGVDGRLGTRRVGAMAESLTKDPLKTSEGPVPLGNEAMTQHQFLAELKDQATSNHPFVRAAEQRVTKAEEALIKATHDMKERGKVTASQVARLKRDLENLEIALEKTRANVSKGVGEGQRPVPFNFRKQGGAVNPAVFDEGFQKTKQVGDYTFEIFGRAHGPEVRIYNAKGEDVGGLSTTAVYKGGEQNLTANFVRVLKEDQKKGLAKEAYAFLAEAGNDIQKSSALLPDGKKMWNRFEETGFAKDGTIRSPGNRQQGAVKIGPGKEPQGKFLEEHPALKLPTIVPTRWTPEQAIDIASKGKDVDQNMLQKALNYGTKGGEYQALKTNNPVIKYAYEKIHEADSLARGDIQDYIHNRLAPVSRSLSRKEASDIWAVVDYHDRSQTPLNLEKLAEMGATPKMIEYAKVHREVMNFAFERLNAARKAADLPPVDKRVAYAAMKSTGDYRQLIYKTGPDGVKSIVGVVGSDFRPVAAHRVKALEAAGFEAGEMKYFGGLPRDRGSAQVAFNHVLEILAKDDPRVREFVDIIDQLGKQEAYNYLNAKKHTMAKKGISGMEGRKDWKTAYDNAKEGMQSQIEYAEQAIKWGHLSEAVQQLRPVLKSDKVQMPNAKKWTEDYISNALGYNPSKVGAALERGIAAAFENTGVGYSQVRGAMSLARRAANTTLLAMSPRFWAQNVVQPFLAMPGMKAYLTTKGLQADFDIGTGYSYIGRAAITQMKAKFGKLNDLETQALAYADKYHVYGSDLIEHSNSARKGFGSAIDRYGNFIAGNIESNTRQTMYLAFTHMLKENGLSVKNGLFEAAHNLTELTMNNYSAVERPKGLNSMGPVGDMAANLSSFKFNEMSRISLLARQIAEEKSARPLATQLMSTTVFAGLTGIMAFAEADWLVKEISKAMGKPTSLTALAIELSEGVGGMMGYKKGDNQSYALSHGAGSLIGLDLSKGLGLQDVVPNSLGEAAFPGGSKLTDMAGALGKAVVKPTEMNLKRAAHSIAPPPVAGNMDIEWFSKDGLAANRKNLNATVERNETDKMAKRFGFTGLNENVQKTKLYEEDWITKAYQKKRESAVANIADVFYGLPKGTRLEESSEGRAAIKRYIDNQGDPNSLAADIARIAKKQNMAAKDRAMLEAAASRSVTNLYRAQRLSKTFKKE